MDMMALRSRGLICRPAMSSSRPWALPGHRSYIDERTSIYRSLERMDGSIENMPGRSNRDAAFEGSQKRLHFSKKNILWHLILKVHYAMVMTYHEQEQGSLTSGRDEATWGVRIEGINPWRKEKWGTWCKACSGKDCGYGLPCILGIVLLLSSSSLRRRRFLLESAQLNSWCRQLVQGRPISNTSQRTLREWQLVQALAARGARMLPASAVGGISLLER